MRRIGLFFCAVLVSPAGIGLPQQANNKPKQPTAEVAPAPAPIPAKAGAKQNPVKVTPEGLSGARKLYGYHGSMGHGKDGDGKGDLAEQMKLKLKDGRNANSISKYTDGELFYIVTNGRGEMVGGEDDGTKEEVRWNLVNLVRSFGQKTAPEAAKQ